MCICVCVRFCPPHQHSLPERGGLESEGEGASKVEGRVGGKERGENTERACACEGARGAPESSALTQKRNAHMCVHMNVGTWGTA